MQETPDDSRSSNPSWRLRFEVRTDHLYADVTGPEDSFDITLAYWREIAAECRRRDARRLLVRDGLCGEPANREDFARLAQALCGSGLENIRIAFLEPVADHLRQVEHGELSMREAGFTLRVFGDERQAMVWLRYGEA